MTEIFQPGEVLRVLQGFNPWWSDRSVKSPPFHRLAFDACRAWMGRRRTQRAILMSGPRRVGKTTILIQLAVDLVKRGHDPKSILYVSLDHPILKLIPLHRIIEHFHNAIWPEGEDCVLLLDEVQYSPGWETEIKTLIDHRPEYRIVATGSASALQRDKVAETGVGRWITVPVPTLSFYEFLHIRNDPLPETSEQLRPTTLFGLGGAEFSFLARAFRGTLPLFHHYLLVGGFPETALEEDVATCQRLLREDVVEGVLKRDMTALFGVRNVPEMERLFIYLCLHSGSIIAHKTCADALGTSPTTVANHLSLLEHANLIYRLPPTAVRGKKVLKARNKYYLCDAALRNAVLLKGDDIFADPEEMGVIAETTVLRHLFAFYYRDLPEITYWRDAKSDKEVDIVVRTRGHLLPFEVKYRDRAEFEPRSGLAAFVESERPDYAFRVTKSETDFSKEPVRDTGVQVLRIPAHILCYLLGQAERLHWKEAQESNT